MNSLSRTLSQTSYTNSSALDLGKFHIKISTAFSYSNRAHLVIQTDMEVVSQLLWSIHRILLMRLCMRFMTTIQTVSFTECKLTVSSIARSNTMVLRAINIMCKVVHLQCHLYPFVWQAHQIITTALRSSGSTLRSSTLTSCTECQHESKSPLTSKDSSRNKENRHLIWCVAILTSRWTRMWAHAVKTSQPKRQE